ncbi:MAG: response regulator [Polyangiaceae bacterium]
MNTSVLIVEDDEQLRSAVARDLTRRGFDVTTVGSVDGALARFDDRQFDVVLTDLRMEGTDGIDLLAALARIAPRTRPILMSAFATARDHQRAVQLGAVQVLCKPFTPAELMRAIQQAVECESGYRGNVHGLSLVDVLQMFHYGRRSLSVFVGGSPPGEIHVQDGEIIHASHGDAVGEEALRQILAVPSGSIQTGPFDTAERNVSRPFQTLLLDVLREIDEEKGEFGEEPVSATRDFAAFDPRPTSPLPVRPAGTTSVDEASRACAQLVARIDGALLCAAIDLEARSLLGFHDTIGVVAKEPEALVADTVDLFTSPRWSGVDDALHPPSDSTPPPHSCLQEIRVLSEDACRLGVGLLGGKRAVVLMTFRETNPALALWHLKATLPWFEQVL